MRSTTGIRKPNKCTEDRGKEFAIGTCMNTHAMQGSMRSVVIGGMAKATHRGVAFKTDVKESSEAGVLRQSLRQQAGELHRRALPENAVILHR